MPEEKKPSQSFSKGKKESFTFSDKIKASKTAGPKSFANRLSSKVGKDGRPKQTILERTKRDAPFLIAALVALLLLPFLYKYSGSVSEAPMITPSSEDSVFDPNAERYAFSPDMDPDGQIAQLSGRDSLSLIAGWGGNEPEVQGDMEDFDYPRDGFASSDDRRASASDTNVDIEENTTNIYKKRAKAATRAAFKRAATKLNTLPGAALRTGPGDKLAVGNWGGRMKDAAKRVGSDTPKSSPKPVSLQPLRPTGTPQRSAYGNQAAAMRQSKDALSKGDAKQGIMDAMVKPVEPGSFGGMGLGDASMGGAGGKMDRNFTFNGKEPWWWDLMKTRSQMQWQKEFERKWDWITWGDKLAQNILKGLINCLVTGDKDGDPDHFLGTSSSSSSKETCCGKEADWFNDADDAKFIKENGLKAFCKGQKKNQLKQGGLDCSRGYKGPSSSTSNGGIVSARLGCMGLAIGGKYGTRKSAAIHEQNDCVEFKSGSYHYDMILEDYARKWKDHAYHWVVARNYVPKVIRPDGLLCSKYTNNLKDVEHSRAAVASINNMSEDELDQVDNLAAALAALDQLRKNNASDADIKAQEEKLKKEFGEEPLKNAFKELEKQNKEKDYKKIAQSAIKNYKYGKGKNRNTEQERLAEQINRESLNDACVIYVGHGQNFAYEDFKTQTIDAFAQLIKENTKKSEEEAFAEARLAFYQLDLFFIEGMASEHKLGYAAWGHSGNMFEHCSPEQAESAKGCKLPMPYWEFFHAYVLRYGSTTQNRGTRNNINNRKYRTFEGENKDSERSEKCYFDNSVKIDCTPNAEPGEAHVTVGRGYHGESLPSVNVNNLDFQVKAQFKPLALGEKESVPPEQDVHPIATEQHNVLQYIFSVPRNGAGEKYYKDGQTEDVIHGNVTWNLYRGGQVIGSAVCPIGLSGDTEHKVTPRKECINKDQSKDCCDKLHPTEWQDWEYVGGVCKEKTKRKSDKEMIRYAPIISWVPTAATNRKTIVPGDPKESEFTPGLVQPAQTKVVNNCGSQIPLMMDSQAAKDFTTDIAQKYNAKHKTDIEAGTLKALSEETLNKYPTDGEFIDALNIAHTEGLATEVSAAAVCELGRDMVRMSLDADVGHKDNPADPGQKYHNELGAFLAYVHDMSLLYPARFLGAASTSVCDERFLAYNYHKSDACNAAAQSNKVPSAHDHNNYNGVEIITYSKYMASLAPEQKEFPLAALGKLGQQNIRYKNCGICTSEVNTYNSAVGYEKMYRDDVSGDGNACVAFAGDAKMSVADALKYVQGVCKVGLNYKPSGQGSKSWSSSQQPTKKGGRGTKDNITQSKSN